MAFPISKIDLEGRAFTRVARFIHKNWPGQDPIKMSFAQEFLSRSLGYKDFHDLQQSAGLIRYRTGPADASMILPLACAELDGAPGLDRMAIKGFVESWPVNLLSFHSGFVRSWAIEGFPEPVIEAMREAYEYCWAFPAGASTQLPSPVSFYAAMNTHLGYKAGRSFSLVASTSILDALDDIHPDAQGRFLEHFQEVHDKLLGVASDLVKQGHFLPADAFNHPELEEGVQSLHEFLSGASLAMLAEHFLEYAIKEKLSQNIFDLYVRRRNGQGFYKEVILGPKPEEYRCRHVFKVPQGELTVVVMDSAEHSSPVSYCSWTARLMSEKGECIGAASGGLFEARCEMTGPGALQHRAQVQGYHEYGLISAFLRKIRQPGVPINRLVDSILNTNAILTVQWWERSKVAPAGTGLAFLSKALEYISDQIEQPLFVVGNIRPLQYVDMNSYDLPKAILDLREEDELRISTYIEQRLDGLEVVKRGLVKSVARLSPEPIASLSDTLSALL